MIRKAIMEDVKKVHQLIEQYGEGSVIPRSLAELYEHLRDFYVYLDGDQVVGVAALHIAWDDLAEVRSLVVHKEHREKEVGTVLVRACLNDARGLGIKNVFVLTYAPGYFKKLGFDEVDKSELPHKIWSDCVKCSKFPDCDETAMLIKLGSQ